MAKAPARERNKMGGNIPVVAIVGRTNVGKSTLFNAIAGRRVSIVDDSHGVTRDRNYSLVTRHGSPFTLIDTGGLIGEEESELQQAVRVQAEVAIREADLILAVLDGVYGPHPNDSDVVELLRLCGKPVLWVVNKCEKPSNELQSGEFYSLGLENLVCVSAAHKVGLDNLIAAIREKLDLDPEGAPPERDGNRPIRVALLGKPNVGKSTLVNRILGEERVVTSDIAGTTRDNIDIRITRDGEDFLLVDTAGLRKKANVEAVSVERYSNLRALKALASSDVAILMIDGTEGPSEQDTKIAGLIHERGRGLVIVVNKWDAVEKDHRTVKAYERMVYERLKFVRYAPIIFASALTGRRCPSILQTVKKVRDQSLIRIQTSELNKIMEHAFKAKPPPVYRGEPIKLFFATQVEVAPPTFVLFVNHPDRLNYSYERYIRNSLRKHYPFEGSDIKLSFRKRTEKSHGKAGGRGSVPA